jgi:hypothetical protein
VLPARQARKEAAAQFHRIGLRFPQQMPFFDELERLNKVTVLRRSAARPVGPKGDRVFTGNLRDDRFLYETARGCEDAVVITLDEGQLSKRAEIRKCTGIDVFSVDEALDAVKD